MYKLVVLAALLALAASAPAPVPKPSNLITPLIYASPSLAVVHAAPTLYHAPAVASYPTAISTQTNTVVHGAKAALVAAPFAYAHHGLIAAPLVHVL